MLTMKSGKTDSAKSAVKSEYLYDQVGPYPMMSIIGDSLKNSKDLKSHIDKTHVAFFDLCDKYKSSIEKYGVEKGDSTAVSLEIINRNLKPMNRLVKETHDAFCQIQSKIDHANRIEEMERFRELVVEEKAILKKVVQIVEREVGKEGMDTIAVLKQISLGLKSKDIGMGVGL